MGGKGILQLTFCFPLVSWWVITRKKLCLQSLRRWRVWDLRIQSLSSEFLGLKAVMEDGTSQNERDRSHFMQVFRRCAKPRGSVEGGGALQGEFWWRLAICTYVAFWRVYFCELLPKNNETLREWWSSSHHMTSLSPIARWVKHDPIHTYTDCESSLHFCYRFLWAVGKLGGYRWDTFFRVDLTFSLVRMACN